MTAHWPVPAGLHTASARLPVEGELPSFGGATGWLNSPPLTAADLGGNVVLVNFWTFTCINWLRQLPYLRAWAGNYSGQGLVVVGVHTPEFVFEKDPDNVSRAVRELRIEYPVAIDNDYAVWSAFDNHYWPAIYFADAAEALEPSWVACCGRVPRWGRRRSTSLASRSTAWHRRGPRQQKGPRAGGMGRGPFPPGSTNQAVVAHIWLAGRGVPGPTSSDLGEPAPGGWSGPIVVMASPILVGSVLQTIMVRGTRRHRARSLRHLPADG
jgi:thiol-disulfide isomerase/thioredoxin